MSIKDVLLLHDENEPGEIRDEIRDAIRERRQDFWQWVIRIAVGGFIALVLWTVAMWAVASALVEDAFDDEPSVTLGEWVVPWSMAGHCQIEEASAREITHHERT